jgi:hypothetical protein
VRTHTHTYIPARILTCIHTKIPVGAARIIPRVKPSAQNVVQRLEIVLPRTKGCYVQVHVYMRICVYLYMQICIDVYMLCIYVYMYTRVHHRHAPACDRPRSTEARNPRHAGPGLETATHERLLRLHPPCSWATQWKDSTV